MKLFLGLILFSSSLLAHEVSDFSYLGVSIDSDAEEALKLLPNIYQHKQYPDGGDCSIIIHKDFEKGVNFLLINNKVRSIYIQDYEKIPAPTIDGLGVGSTKADVVAKYPDIKSEHHPWAADGAEYLSIEFSNGKGLLFETSATGIVTELRFSKISELYLSESCS